MSYAVNLTSAASRQLAALDRGVQRRVYDRLRELSEDPRRPGTKKLEGKGAPVYRARVGDYRILYEIHDAQLVVMVLRIAHRREVYRDQN